MPDFTKRQFLTALAAGTSYASLGRAAPAPLFAPRPQDGWKRYAVTTTLNLATPGRLAQAWVPLPSVSDPAWVTPLGNDWHGADFSAREVDAGGARMLHVMWEPGATPAIAVTSRFASRDRAVNWNDPRPVAPLSVAERAQYTGATQYIPVTGPIARLSGQIVQGLTGDRARAAAIYGWVVCNTHRDHAVRGCGTGNVGAMLKYADFGGKCADLNGLFVGLVRAAGIPARDIYGVRVAQSQFGYRSLGANTADVTSAQHCRAEVYLEGYGWTAMDPADVRKVMLDEVKGGLTLTDPRVAAVRKGLFGAWEGNWMPYNHANDVALPGGGGRVVPFLMYPQAQVDGVWLDPLAPKTMRYSLHAEAI
ncbi:transglutaminase-like domain-containing protein [Acidocella sp.]|uniref:transglutaminase-like domain-containing protein n=1 Tax=Acidocella sp. TaxID=50710 RepID=UPI0026203A17|nr:transglutaminase domain-containing protein [Acidocella sp.]